MRRRVAAASLLPVLLACLAASAVCPGFAGQCFSRQRYCLRGRGLDRVILWWTVADNRYYEFLDGLGGVPRLEVRRLNVRGDELEASWLLEDPVAETTKGVCVSSGAAYLLVEGGLLRVAADGSREFIPGPWKRANSPRCVGWKGVLVVGETRLWHWTGARWEAVYEAPDGWNVATVTTSKDEHWIGIELVNRKDKSFRGVLLDVRSGRELPVHVEIPDFWVGIAGGDDPRLILLKFCDEKDEREMRRTAWGVNCGLLVLAAPGGQELCAERVPYLAWRWNAGRLWLLGLEKGAWWLEGVDPAGGQREKRK